MSRVKLALIITYNGRDFDGWQDNLNNHSIEGCLKKAFFALIQKEYVFDAASRTDKGVHALYQVVTTHHDPSLIPIAKLHFAINSKLPAEIRIKKAVIVPEEFHPSLSIKSKTYLYKLNCNVTSLPFDTNLSWHIPGTTCLETMQAAAKHFIGTKDFSSFTNATNKASTNPTCTIEHISISEDNLGAITIEITGDRFLYKMCRIIVGTIVTIGRGKIKSADIDNMMNKKNRSLAGITAPSCGLFLKSLHYPLFNLLTL